MFIIIIRKLFMCVIIKQLHHFKKLHDIQTVIELNLYFTIVKVQKNSKLSMYMAIM